MTRQRSMIRNSVGGFLVVLSGFGVALIALGARDTHDFWREFAIGVGIAVGPAALVALLLRFFLVEDIKAEAIEPLTDLVHQRLDEEIRDQVCGLLQDFRSELVDFQNLRQAGVIRSYKSRSDALPDFMEYVKRSREVIVIGSSLSGLLSDDSEFVHLLRSKQASHVKIVMTHPVIADLRARQENRKLQAIGTEIIASLELLANFDFPAQNVFLYKGAPTCFAIKADNHMLLNPYPYNAVAVNSPCLLVEGNTGAQCYFYDTFNQAHFSVLGSAMTERLSDLRASADQLRMNLPIYSDRATSMLELSAEEQAPPDGAALVATGDGHATAGVTSTGVAVSLK